MKTYTQQNSEGTTIPDTHVLTGGTDISELKKEEIERIRKYHREVPHNNHVLILLIEIDRLRAVIDDLTNKNSNLYDDLMKTANSSLCRMSVAQHLEIMKQAVLTEREECANITEVHQADIDCDLDHIAEEIRARGEKL